MNPTMNDFALRQTGILRHAMFCLAVSVFAVAATQNLLAAQPPEPPAPNTDSIPPVENSVPDSSPPIEAGSMSDEEGEAMLRGPVHEAFAEQVDANPVPGMLVLKKNPEPVEELPPDVRPEGRNVEWISGYWAWDDDRDDFMWVSGIWREIPQGFRWLPGYWAEVDGGFQWVSGTWVSTQTAEIEYLDTAPPATLETGPAGVAPSSQHIWIPGCWNWRDTRYAWRPGFWSTGYSNWMWVPSRYRWTPRGCYFANGYWDYPIDRRGVLFAPYCFRRPVYARRGFLFTPRVMVAANLLPFHLWVRPRYQHYYFGDYYNRSYAGLGFMPWHQHYRQNRGFDPMFCHYSRFRGGSAFYNQVNARFNNFVSNPELRPAHTLFEQDRTSAMRLNKNDRHDSMLGTRFQNVVDDAARNVNGPRFVKLETEQKQRIRTETEQVRSLIGQRQRTEGVIGKRDLAGTNAEQLDKGRIVQGAKPDDKPAAGRPKADEPKAREVARTESDRSDRLKLPKIERHPNANQSDLSKNRRDGRSEGGPTNQTGVSQSARVPSNNVQSGERQAVTKPEGTENARREAPETRGRSATQPPVNSGTGTPPSRYPKLGNSEARPRPIVGTQDSDSRSTTPPPAKSVPRTRSETSVRSTNPRSSVTPPSGGNPQANLTPANRSIRSESAATRGQGAGVPQTRSQERVPGSFSGNTPRGGGVSRPTPSRPTESPSLNRPGGRPGGSSAANRSQPGSVRGNSSPPRGNTGSGPASRGGSRGRSKD